MLRQQRRAIDQTLVRHFICGHARKSPLRMRVYHTTDVVIVIFEIETSSKKKGETRLGSPQLKTLIHVYYSLSSQHVQCCNISNPRQKSWLHQKFWQMTKIKVAITSQLQTQRPFSQTCLWFPYQKICLTTNTLNCYSFRRLFIDQSRYQVKRVGAKTDARSRPWGLRPISTGIRMQSGDHILPP